jgi:UDP-N-acetylmuramoyl-tripeptide--D-alanyl-D-alanine ligase
MIQVSAKELAEILHGELLGDPDSQVTGSVETDSRLVTVGSLFFAKPGEKQDGHDFLADAFAKGSTVAIVQRKISSEKITQIVVPDVVKALGSLAAWLLVELRKSTDLKVVAITGSNGKTTTKNMLRQILGQLGETIAPIESFNNQVGAPISVLRADKKTKFLVVELGAEGKGSIDYLARIADPDIAVVLKVGLAHVGEFGGIENTAAIKAELVRALRPDAILVLNADDSYVRQMASLTKSKTIWFGTNWESQYRATDFELTRTGTSYLMNWPNGQTNKVELKILGEHHVMNALAASAVAEQLGASHSQITQALEEMELAERWRMQRVLRSDGVTVINDAYNASPDSMKAALQTLAQLGKLGTRTIAVLGEMAELGEFSRTEHDSIGRLVVRLNIDQLVVIGMGAKLIHMGASQEGSWDGESIFFETIDEALSYLRGILVDGDTVLVKSSKSANLRFLGDDLMEVPE